HDIRETPDSAVVAQSGNRREDGTLTADRDGVSARVESVYRPQDASRCHGLRDEPEVEVQHRTVAKPTLNLLDLGAEPRRELVVRQLRFGRQRRERWRRRRLLLCR